MGKAKGVVENPNSCDNCIHRTGCSLLEELNGVLEPEEGKLFQVGVYLIYEAVADSCEKYSS